MQNTVSNDSCASKAKLKDESEIINDEVIPTPLKNTEGNSKIVTRTEKTTDKIKNKEEPEVVYDHPRNSVKFWIREQEVGKHKENENRYIFKSHENDRNNTATVQQQKHTYPQERNRQTEDNPVQEQQRELVEAYPISEKHLCLPDFICNNEKVKITKKVFAVIVVILICCLTIGLVVLFTSKKSSSNSPETQPPSYYTPTQPPTFYNTPSQTPSSTPPPKNLCNGVCLEKIEQAECPQDISLLKSCHAAVISNICLNNKDCPTNISPQNCGSTNLQIYRRRKCPIDEPWTRATNGFEYYIETISMDWESHNIKARQSNASLASVHSESEINFISQMMASQRNTTEAYLGGLRKGISNDPWNNGTAMYWKWADDTPWDFIDWKVGQPDDRNAFQDKHESVVVINDAKMQDDLSDIRLPAIYKRKIRGYHTGTTQLVARSGQTCALNFQGKLYCWGWNELSQLGDGTTTNKIIPKAITTNIEGKIPQIALGWAHSCAIVDDGASLMCWGYNIYGQLGDGTTTNKVYPTKINIGSKPTHVAAGSAHSCTILDDGSLKCWGENTIGQLGDGTNVRKLTPTQINAGGKVVYIAAGGYSSCAIYNDSSLKCWGYNSFGQIGDGTNITKFNPTLIIGRDVTQVAVAASYSCAVLKNGSLQCWGQNHLGQLGDGTSTNRLNPITTIQTDISTSKKVVQVAVGNAHTCAVFNDGSLECWGSNGYGQLGDGTTNNSLSPIPINVGGPVVHITLGSYHTCAILKNDGSIKCWGYNMFGQLGDGTTINHVNASSSKFILI